jgi:hypothetical protein
MSENNSFGRRLPPVVLLTDEEQRQWAAFLRPFIRKEHDCIEREAGAKRGEAERWLETLRLAEIGRQVEEAKLTASGQTPEMSQAGLTSATNQTP